MIKTNESSNARWALLLPIIFLLLIQIGCSAKPAESRVEDLRPALEKINANDLLRNIKMLSSDAFEGRAPGTRGEKLTVEYLISQFKTLGLMPGNPDGTYVQHVPMVTITGNPSAYFALGNQRMALRHPEDYVAVSPHAQRAIKIDNADMLFVGYGIVAPEYNWDDYKGADVRGKTLVMLIGDPPIADPADPSRLDEKMFSGKAMTYYGRWTYKYEIAAQLGASAAVLIHETGPAGYPYEVLVNSWGKESSILDTQNPEKRVAVESWITKETAEKLFTLAGFNFDELKKAALRRDFKPVSLEARANFAIKNSIARIKSDNVVGKIEASDPQRRDQYLIYSAHWDHLGKNERLKGDQIYHGASDNASGVAGILEIARAYKQLAPYDGPTVLFMALTGEEKGLLGSEYYAGNPLYPLDQTIADINIDNMNTWGLSRDIIIVGLDSSPLHNVARQVAKMQGRRIEPDPQPEKGFVFRSDSFEFSRKGVPALYIGAGVDLIGKPADYGRRRHGEYTEHDYHNATDVVKPDWDLSGAVEDLQFLFQVGYKFSREAKPIRPKLPAPKVQRTVNVKLIVNY